MSAGLSGVVLAVCVGEGGIPKFAVDSAHVTVNGVKLHYVRQGSGEPLMLIHGWPGFWYEWHLNIEPLAKHFDVIVPDMRGFAYSDKPDVAPEVGYTDSVFAEDIKAFLDFYHFDTMRIGMVGGRDFRIDDTAPTLDREKRPVPGVGIVNETFARVYFGAQMPVGWLIIVRP